MRYYTCTYCGAERQENRVWVFPDGQPYCVFCLAGFIEAATGWQATRVLASWEAVRSWVDANIPRRAGRPGRPRKNRG